MAAVVATDEWPRRSLTMSIAGHVSRAMLSRYSHVRMEAKRRALDEIAARQCAADVKRKEEAMRRHAAAATQSVVVQWSWPANRQSDASLLTGA